MNKFTYKIIGIKGDIVYTDFCSDGITIVIEANRISDSADKIRQYLADTFLKCDKVILEKIEFIK